MWGSSAVLFHLGGVEDAADGVTGQPVDAVALGALVTSRDGVGDQERRALALASHDHRAAADREVPLAARGLEGDVADRVGFRNVHRGNRITCPGAQVNSFR